MNPPLRYFTLLILSLLFLQLVYGALMAGHKAATAAPTWPAINGAFIPPAMMAKPAGLVNLLENKITIHFIHRTLGYIIFLLLIGWTFRLLKTPGSVLMSKSKYLPLSLALLQVVLGILTVISSIHIIPNKWGLFEWIAQCHQLVAMLLLLSLVWMLYLFSGQKQSTYK